MRVLYWADYFWPYVGGVEVWSARLLPALAGRGHELTVITSHGALDLPDEDVYEGIPVFRFPFWRALEHQDVQLLARLRRAVADFAQRLGPDLIHVNLTTSIAYFALKIVETVPAPLLVSYHHPMPTQDGHRGETLVGRLLHAADWVNCFAATVLDDLRRWAPEIVSRSSLVPHGLAASAVPAAPLPLDRPRLLCLGRLVPGKGFDLALEAFALIAHRFPEARMVMASDGPERSSLEELARRRGIADRVDFIGWVAFEDISALLNASTIVLMPSRLPEGFGLVALEAALMARPVIAARAGALQEVVVDGRTGLLVDAEDHAALARAIERLLANPQEAIDLGACAQRRAREHYTWARHVEAFDALYRARARR